MHRRHDLSGLPKAAVVNQSLLMALAVLSSQMVSQLMMSSTSTCPSDTQPGSSLASLAQSRQRDDDDKDHSGRLAIASGMEVEEMGTFKQLKGKLVEPGFNPDGVTDPLYFLNEQTKTLTPLTPMCLTPLTPMCLTPLTPMLLISSGSVELQLEPGLLSTSTEQMVWSTRTTSCSAPSGPQGLHSL
ncbi:unnamed protein product [Merluccius merluccius]